MKKKRGKKSIDVIRTLGEIDGGMIENFSSPEHFSRVQVSSKRPELDLKVRKMLKNLEIYIILIKIQILISI